MKKFYYLQNAKKMKKLFFLVMIVSCAFPLCEKKETNFVTHNFSKQQWLGGLNDIFNGMKLHLNNFTPTKHQYEQDDNYAYGSPTSSSLDVPAVSSVPFVFDSPVTRQDPYSVYINDVNFSGFTTDAYNYITVAFESDGTEIMGDCVNNLICVCGSPRLDLTNTTALIPLTFAPGSGGAVNIAAGDVAFTANIAESGPCVNNACAFLCDIFEPNSKATCKQQLKNLLKILLIKTAV